MPFDELFFPELSRREQYTLTRRGEYYADYTVYRQEIREDCLGRCVYCDIHENENGGKGTMQLDHFRPQSCEEYRHLANDPTNLVWSCPVCNRFKSDTWPALGTDETFVDECGFVDAFEEDRNDYFSAHTDGRLEAMKSPAEFMIELLALNRQFSKRCRELRVQRWERVRRIEQMIERTRKLKERAAHTTQDDVSLSELEAHEEELLEMRDWVLSLLDFDLH